MATPATGASAAAAAAAGDSSIKKQYTRRKSGRVFDPYDPFFPEDAVLVGSSSLISSPNTIEPTDAAFIKPPPMPSVHTDGRGEVHNLLIGSYHSSREKKAGKSDNKGDGSSDKTGTTSGGESSDESKASAPPAAAAEASSSFDPGSIGARRINLSHTKKGVMRHGDFHPNTQCGFVFSGSVEVWQPTPDGTTLKTIYGPKDYIEIPPYVPHVYNYLEDTIMAEWWEQTGTGASAHFKHWFYGPYRRLVDVSYVHTTAGEKGKLMVFREVGKTFEDGELGLSLPPPQKTNWAAWFGAGLAVGAAGFVLGVSVGRGKG